MSDKGSAVLRYADDIVVDGIVNGTLRSRDDIVEVLDTRRFKLISQTAKKIRVKWFADGSEFDLWGAKYRADCDLNKIRENICSRWLVDNYAIDAEAAELSEQVSDMRLKRRKAFAQYDRGILPERCCTLAGQQGPAVSTPDTNVEIYEPKIMGGIEGILRLFGEKIERLWGHALEADAAVSCECSSIARLGGPDINARAGGAAPGVTGNSGGASAVDELCQTAADLDESLKLLPATGDVFAGLRSPAVRQRDPYADGRVPIRPQLPEPQPRAQQFQR